MIRLQTVCPICGDDVEKPFLCKVSLASDTSFDLLECSGCGVIFTSPLPTETQLAEFYTGSYYEFNRSRLEGKGMAFAGRLRRWREKGRFLDIGCATGFFMNGIRKYSEWEVYGVDFGEKAVRYARDELGLEVKHGELSDAGYPPAFFDYIHVNNVLEHVLDPVWLLRECRRIIKPDGIFYLSVPNGFNDSLDLINFYEIDNMPARSKNGHIFFFPARTLIRLFDHAGFVIAKKKTYGLKRGLRSMGYWPRKKDWRKDYMPRKLSEAERQSEIRVTGGTNGRSNLYYRCKFFLDNLRRVPGLYRFGLDFLFTLRPKT